MDSHLKHTVAGKDTYADAATYQAAVHDARARDAEIEDRRAARALAGPEGDALRAAEADVAAAFAAYESVKNRVGAFAPEAREAWDAVMVLSARAGSAMLAALRVIETR